MSVVAYVGLGANLGNRRATLRLAVRALDEHPDVSVTGETPLRETVAAPPSPPDDPPFLNGVVRVFTRLTAADLLDLLQTLEADFGRERSGPGARAGSPRTLDLDLLLYGDEVHDRPELTLPHPRIRERPFVLEPLLELDPSLGDRL